MSRNASGVYTLPAGNPVVTGTTITSSWANGTLGDLGTEMTDSLDRSGKGGMLAQFKAFAGTAGAPGISWADELDSGIYRVGAKDFKLQVNAGTVMEWTDALVRFPIGARAESNGNGTVALYGATSGDTGALAVDGYASGANSIAVRGISDDFYGVWGESLSTFAAIFGRNSSSAAGGQFSNTGTGAPLNLVPKAAPSVHTDGNMWVETGTNTLKVRINGVTKTVTLT